MSDPAAIPDAYSDAEWRQRLRAAVEETLRKRAAKRQERREMQARRAHGLEARHRNKLARNQQEAAIPVSRVQAPDDDGRWQCPEGATAVRAALDRCRVPTDATPSDARRILELAGIYASSGALTRALRTRRTQEHTR